MPAPEFFNYATAFGKEARDAYLLSKRNKVTDDFLNKELDRIYNNRKKKNEDISNKCIPRNG